MTTKWDILQERLAIAREQQVKIEEELDYLLKTPFKVTGSDEPNRCSKCEEVLETEADFAKHFIVPDVRYLNLGYCPKRSD